MAPEIVSRAFCGGTVWQRYLAIYSSVALAVAMWLFGPDVIDWWFRQPASLTWKLITSVLLIAGFAVSVALYNLLWINRATQARVLSLALVGLMIRLRRAKSSDSEPGPGTLPCDAARRASEPDTRGANPTEWPR
jgi:hypothetical protein